VGESSSVVALNSTGRCIALVTTTARHKKSQNQRLGDWTDTTKIKYIPLLAVSVIKSNAAQEVRDMSETGTTVQEKKGDVPDIVVVVNAGCGTRAFAALDQKTKPHKKKRG